MRKSKPQRGEDFIERWEGGGGGADPLNTTFTTELITKILKFIMQQLNI